MPDTSVYPLGGNGDILQDLIRRVEILEARARVIQNGAINFVDNSGNVLMVLGQQADGTTGIRFFNPGGTEEVRVGELNAAPDIYGLAVRPSDGSALQQVGGTLFTFNGSTYTTTSTSWVVPTGNQAITATVGPSGRADCTIGAHVATGAVSQEGYIGLVVDGSTPPAFAVGTSESVGAGGLSEDVFGRFTVTGLTPGSHTFKIYAWTANNGANNVGFSNMALTVTPL